MRVVNFERIYIYIRECGSTLYVGLVHAVSPTNTNFRLTFLLTRLHEALYEDYLYRASNLKSIPSLFWPLFHSGSQFLAPVKTVVSCDLFIIANNNYHFHHHYQLLQKGFLRAVTTSLIPIDAILPEICTFIIDFGCTHAWTINEVLASSLADCVLADAILIPPRPHHYNEGKGSSKSRETEKPFTTKRRCRDG